MPSLLVVCYETTNARWYVQKIGSDQISPASIISSLIASGAIGGDHIAAGAILSGNIGSGQVGLPHIRGGPTSGQVLTAQAALAPVWGAVPPPGPGTILSSQIGSGQLGHDLIRPGGILSAHIASGQVGSDHIQNQGVLSGNIGALAIGIPHLAANAVVSGKLGSGAIPDNSVSEGQLVSGISIDIAETLSEPTATAIEPVSSHACVVFMSGYGGKKIGLALANNFLLMPAVGKIGPTALASGAAMTTNPILTYGRQPSPIGSGNIGRLVYVGTNAQPTCSAPSASGNCVQAIAEVMDNDGLIMMAPQPFFIQVAA